MSNQMHSGASTRGVHVHKRAFLRNWRGVGSNYILNITKLQGCKSKETHKTLFLKSQELQYINYSLVFISNLFLSSELLQKQGLVYSDFNFQKTFTYTLL